MLERLNEEIRRRTRVVGIFANTDSYLRLVTTFLMEYAEDWSVSRAYLSEESICALLSQAAKFMRGAHRICKLYLTLALTKETLNRITEIFLFN